MKRLAFIAMVCTAGLLLGSCSDSNDNGRHSDRSRDRDKHDSPNPVGQWSYSDAQRQARFTFNDDGTFSSEIRAGDASERSAGKYRIDDDKLEISPDDGEKYQMKWRLVDDQLEVANLDGSEARRLTRVGGGRRGDESDGGTRAGRDRQRRDDEPHAHDAGPTPQNLDEAVRDYRLPQPRRYDDAGFNPDAISESPSGHIVYTRGHPIQAAGATTWFAKLYVMAGDGRGQAPFIVPPGPVHAETACWSPDGRCLMFASDYRMQDSACIMDIWKADPRSGMLQRLTGVPGSSAAGRKTGSIYGVVEDTAHNSINPYASVMIFVQGCDGRTYRLSANRIDKEGRNVPNEYVFSIDNVPAGMVWVRAYVNSHIGDLKTIYLPAGGHEYVGNLNLQGGNFQASRPKITPDGRYVVYTARLLQHSSMAAKGKDAELDSIAVLDLRAPIKPAAMLDQTQMGGLIKDPALSYDGRWVALSLGMPRNEAIVVCSLDSILRGQPDARVVVPGQNSVYVGYGNTQPAWSPDGRQIAFIRYSLNNDNATTSNLCIVNADGSGLRQITQVPANQLVNRPCWSPDGKRLAFHLAVCPRTPATVSDVLLRNFSTDIWTIRADGSDPQQLTSDGVSADPTWGQ